MVIEYYETDIFLNMYYNSSHLNPSIVIFINGRTKDYYTIFITNY